MARAHQLTLDDLDLGQILDGLEIRAEAWEKTAKYLRTAEIPIGEIFVVEECSKPEEAESIAQHYRAIIARIRSQIEASPI